jgi:heat shock protein HspQ
MITVDVPCRFALGEIVRHCHDEVRGVVMEVDDCFRGDEEAYQSLPGIKPAKAQPWYHVLLDGEDHIMYLPEHHLESDVTGEPVVHPLLCQVFNGFENGKYSRLLH